MILSDSETKKRIEGGTLVIKSPKGIHYQPASVDLRIGNTFLVMDALTNGAINLEKPAEYKEIVAEEITIPPRSFVLAMTEEYIEMPDDLAAFIEGRSSIGRMGLFIQNAGWIDPGFKGHFTLQLFNANALPIKLNAGRRVCQVVFCEMKGDVENAYKGKYQNQMTPTGSRIFSDDEVS